MRRGELIIATAIAFLLLSFGTGAVIVYQEIERGAILECNEQPIAVPIWLNERDCSPSIKIVPCKDVHSVDLTPCLGTGQIKEKIGERDGNRTNI